jgi:hypothetical protein
MKSEYVYEMSVSQRLAMWPDLLAKICKAPCAYQRRPKGKGLVGIEFVQPGCINALDELDQEQPIWNDRGRRRLRFMQTSDAASCYTFLAG